MLKTFSKFKQRMSNQSNLKHLTLDETKALQVVLLGMLCDFDALCQRNHLTYFLTGGSALGAVRHCGFIPWDDDIDVIMPRRDYERLNECVQRELGDSYWVQSLATSEVYDLNFMRFRKLGTKYIEIFENEPKKAGVCIDIFALDDTYDCPLFSFAYGVINEGLHFITSCVRMYQKKDRLLNYVSDKELIRAIKFKSYLGALFNEKRNPKKWYAICEAWNRSVDNPSAKYLAVASGRGHYFGERYCRNEIFPLQLMQFEGYKFPVARNSAYFLTKLYGKDYLIPPDKQFRESHGFVEVEF